MPGARRHCWRDAVPASADFVPVPMALRLNVETEYKPRLSTPPGWPRQCGMRRRSSKLVRLRVVACGHRFSLLGRQINLVGCDRLSLIEVCEGSGDFDFETRRPSPTAPPSTADYRHHLHRYRPFARQVLLLAVYERLERKLQRCRNRHRACAWCLCPESLLADGCDARHTDRCNGQWIHRCRGPVRGTPRAVDRYCP